MVNLHGEVKLEIEENFILQTLSCKLEFTKHVNCILQDLIFTCAVNFQLFQWKRCLRGLWVSFYSYHNNNSCHIYIVFISKIMAMVLRVLLWNYTTYERWMCRTTKKWLHLLTFRKIERKNITATLQKRAKLLCSQRKAFCAIFTLVISNTRRLVFNCWIHRRHGLPNLQPTWTTRKDYWRDL